MSHPFFILIPAYEAAEFLPQLLKSLKDIVDPQQILIVNDGSQDRTEELAQSEGVQVCSHSQNQGKAQALITGFQWGMQEGYSWAITLDADGQHSPSDLNQFISQISSGDTPSVGALLGAREFAGSMPRSRVFSNSTTTRILSYIAGQPLWDSQCGYRAYRLEALDQCRALEISTQGFQWESEVLVKMAWSQFQFIRIPVQTIYNDQGSHISHLSDTWKFIQMWCRLIFEKRKINGNH